MIVTKSIIASLATMLLVYLLGAFIGADFNIGNWTNDGRFLVGVIGIMSGVVAGIVVYAEGLKD